MNRLALLAFTLFVAGLACGCPKNIPPPDNALTEPSELRAAVDARTKQVETARFKEVVLDYFGKGERVKVRQLLLVKQPSFLRVQTRIPGSNEILSLLVSDGESFALHKRDTNEYFTGEPTAKNIARLLPVDLSAHDVVRVMLGGAPWDRFDEQGSEPTMEWDSRKGKYSYEVETRDGGTLTMLVRHTDYAVVSVRQRNDDDDVVYAYTTEDWERHGGLALPDYRRFVWPARDLDFSMDVGETQVDIELPNSLFVFPPPPGSKVMSVEGR